MIKKHRREILGALGAGAVLLFAPIIKQALDETKRAAAAERVWEALGKESAPNPKDFELVRSCCVLANGYPDIVISGIQIKKGNLAIDTSETFGMVTLQLGNEWRYFSPETCTIAKGTDADQVRLGAIKNRDMETLAAEYRKAPENQSDVPVRIVRPGNARNTNCPIL